MRGLALDATSAGSLPQLLPGQSLGLALGIASVPNLRDLGGYEAAAGAIVARGLIYRSDAFNPMSAEDIAKVARLGLKNAYDLRTTAEVEVRPDHLPPGVEYRLLNVLAGARSAAPAELQALLHEPKKANRVLGNGRIEDWFIDSYREFVSLPSATRSYRALFLSLASPERLPAVFHCTSGKDRTGWAAAALLTLLGVPKETVTADYLCTNEYILPQFARVIDGFVAGDGDRAIAEAIFGVKAEYLRASFEQMQEAYGSIEEYFAAALDIDAAGQQALKKLYLAKP